MSATRRQFLKAAGVAGAGVALAGSRGLWTPASAAPLAMAKLGVFAEPEGTEKGYVHALSDFESQIGRGVDIYRSYRSWGQSIMNDTIGAILSTATAPELYLSFHAFFDSKGNNCIAWSDIAAGKYDSAIDSWANELKTNNRLRGRHTYLCFNHEMENELGTPPTGCGTATDFRNAYWYFRGRMENTNNVPAVTPLTWVITFMGNTFRGKHVNPDTWWPLTSDPGYSGVPDDALVGVDLYNRYLCHGKQWFSFSYLSQDPSAKPISPYAYAVAKNRKLFIGECGSVEHNACGGTTLPTAKADWFNEALADMQGWNSTKSTAGQLEAFCYSNVGGFNSGNYHIDSSAEAQAAFKALANNRLFT